MIYNQYNMSGTAILSYIIISISVIYAFTMPFIEKMSALSAQEVVYQDKIEKVHQIESRKNALLIEYNKINAQDVKKVETLIPSSLNFVKLAADIDAVASRYGISINNVAVVNNQAPVDSVAASETVDTRTHNSAAFSFEFTSSYSKFNDFLNDLEKSLRILDIKSIDITTGEEGVYVYKVTFDTYWAN